MKDLVGKVAVVTGAASGIGRALATAFAGEGMRVVLADVEAAALDEAAHAIGGDAIAVRTDVSKSEDVEALALAAERAFGAVHVVCNNAGVSVSGLAWTHTLADWEWVLGVNLWGVIHGVRAFMPRLLAAGEGHVVNTGSIAGLISGPGTAVYSVTKHGVVTLSECLHHELRMMGSAVGVSVLCPAWVNTRILDSARNRPAALAATGPSLPGREQMEEFVRGLLAGGLPPARVAALVVDAVRTKRFWVLPHPEWKAFVRTRMEDVLQEREPTPSAVESLPNPGMPSR